MFSKKIMALLKYFYSLNITYKSILHHNNLATWHSTPQFSEGEAQNDTL